MKKRIIAGIIALVVLCVVLGIMCDTAFVVAGHTNDNYSKEELTTLITEAQSIKDNAHTMADSARVLGWEEDDTLIRELQEKWHEAHEDQARAVDPQGALARPPVLAAQVLLGGLRYLISEAFFIRLGL